MVKYRRFLLRCGMIWRGMAREAELIEWLSCDRPSPVSPTRRKPAEPANTLENSDELVKNNLLPLKRFFGIGFIQSSSSQGVALTEHGYVSTPPPLPRIAGDDQTTRVKGL